MNFDEAYEKYVNKTANEEEIAYVEREVARAKSILDSCEAAKPEISTPDKSEYTKAKKKLLLKNVITGLVISVASILIICGVVLGSVFGVAVTSAKDSVTLNENQAKELAIAYATENYAQTGDKVTVKDFEKEFDMKFKLKNSYYYYDIEVGVGKTGEADFIINAKTGEIEYVGMDVEDHR